MLDETKSREYSDRRQTPTPVFSRYSLSGGRRRLVRRSEDKKKHLFVDLYSARLLIAIVLLMCLSSLDAYLTLELIERGKVIEANPIMAYFLNIGIMPFTTIKFVVTATALIVLCVFKNVPVTRISLPVAIKIYMGVIAYECYLFMI
jgi:hypothetical protein